MQNVKKAQKFDTLDISLGSINLLFTKTKWVGYYNIIVTLSRVLLIKARKKNERKGIYSDETQN